MRRILLTAGLATYCMAASVSAYVQAATPTGAQPHVVVITHGDDESPFWRTLLDGARTAAAEVDVALDLRPSADGDMAQMAAAIRKAASERPDGMVISVPDPAALGASIMAATAGGTPLVTINIGGDLSKSLGALLHIGQNEYEAGYQAGRRMAALGGEQGLCILHDRRDSALDQRCIGFAVGFGHPVVHMWLAASEDEERVSSAFVRAFAASPHIDSILSAGGGPTQESILETARALRPDIRIGVFDAEDWALTAAAHDQIDVIVDQQEFLQGYLAVSLLNCIIRKDMAPTSMVTTGPRLLGPAEARARLARGT